MVRCGWLEGRNEWRIPFIGVIWRNYSSGLLWCLTCWLGGDNGCSLQLLFAVTFLFDVGAGSIISEAGTMLERENSMVLWLSIMFFTFFFSVPSHSLSISFLVLLYFVWSSLHSSLSFILLYWISALFVSHDLHFLLPKNAKTRLLFFLLYVVLNRIPLTKKHRFYP